MVVKGGDIRSEAAIDLLLDGSGELVLTGKRYLARSMDPGCVFSAAITAFPARGMPVQGAAERAKGFMDGALGRAYPGKGGRLWADPMEGSLLAGNRDAGR